MRSHSELSFERAKDGIRIVLSRGGIVVNAAKQRTGHLYVQTKDMTVSVIGTVFVVNADEAGSRVAVVEGEVRVQQGNTQTKLRSGEGLASSPNRETFSVASELAWSRRAAALAALMNQAGADSPAVTRVVADEQVARAEAPRRFEVATIRRVPAPGGGGGRRGGSGGPAGPAAGAPPCLAGGPLGRPLEVDPSRFAASGVTLRFLVLLAYGGDCRYLSGGPDWMASERYDVEARIPAGAATYTREQLRAGKAPQLQEMLRQLLAERFALSVRLEPREAPVYHLVVVQEGRMKPADGAPSPAGAPLSTPSGRGGLVLPPGQVPAPGTAIMTLRGTTDGVATALSGLVDRPVVNRTNLSGLFQVWLEWDNGMRDHGAVDPDPRFANNAMIFQALQNQLGLKLEPATGVMEAIVIERAAPPTDN
jgi:uncharacterized protein (TIGR03435 family)